MLSSESMGLGATILCSSKFNFSKEIVCRQADAEVSDDVFGVLTSSIRMSFMCGFAPSYASVVGLREEMK